MIVFWSLTVRMDGLIGVFFVIVGLCIHADCGGDGGGKKIV